MHVQKKSRKLVECHSYECSDRVGEVIIRVNSQVDNKHYISWFSSGCCCCHYSAGGVFYKCKRFVDIVVISEIVHIMIIAIFITFPFLSFLLLLSLPNLSHPVHTNFFLIISIVDIKINVMRIIMDSIFFTTYFHLSVGLYFWTFNCPLNPPICQQTSNYICFTNEIPGIFQTSKNVYHWTLCPKKILTLRPSNLLF